MREYITRLTSTVLLAAVLTGPGLGETDLSAARTPEGSQTPCTGIEATFEKGLVLYDSNPKPLPWLPILASEPRAIGIIQPEQELTICTRVDRSTWNTRSAWLEIRTESTDSAGGNVEDSQTSGWINTSQQEADLWVPLP